MRDPAFPEDCLESAHASAFRWCSRMRAVFLVAGGTSSNLPFGAHPASVTLTFQHRGSKKPKYDFAFSLFLLIEKQNIQLENKRLRKKEEWSLAFQSGRRGAFASIKGCWRHIQLGLIWKYRVFLSLINGRQGTEAVPVITRKCIRHYS